ncbi:hypothetical protein HK096_003903 [Nowakowskiella sp. JEL0078]|nr:hypothetical protein HK096_003903 [Nowakowskiella sp. JEL0078]
MFIENVLGTPTFKYEAVSHVWGNAVEREFTWFPAKTLFLNENQQKHKLIRNWLAEKVMLWIDIISIAQDGEAKLSQINNMDKIYQNAVNTRIILESSSLKIKFEKIIYLVDSLKDFAAPGSNSGSDHIGDSKYTPFTDKVIVLIELLNDVLSGTNFRSRLWTLQEEIFSQSKSYYVIDDDGLECAVFSASRFLQSLCAAFDDILESSASYKGWNTAWILGYSSALIAEVCALFGRNAIIYWCDAHATLGSSLIRTLAGRIDTYGLCGYDILQEDSSWLRLVRETILDPNYTGDDFSRTTLKAVTVGSLVEWTQKHASDNIATLKYDFDATWKKHFENYTRKCSVYKDHFFAAAKVLCIDLHGINYEISTSDAMKIWNSWLLSFGKLPLKTFSSDKLSKDFAIARDWWFELHIKERTKNFYPDYIEEDDLASSDLAKHYKFRDDLAYPTRNMIQPISSPNFFPKVFASQYLRFDDSNQGDPVDFYDIFEAHEVTIITLDGKNMKFSITVSPGYKLYEKIERSGACGILKAEHITGTPYTIWIRNKKDTDRIQQYLLVIGEYFQTMVLFACCNPNFEQLLPLVVTKREHISAAKKKKLYPIGFL